MRVLVSCVSAERAEQIHRHLAAAAIEAEVVVANNASLLNAADLVLVASGTATLEVAYYRKPMIVMYDAGRLMSGLYRTLGRWLIRTPHLCLVNILAGRRVVPEFMPYVPDVAAVAKVADVLLSDAIWRELMVRQLDEIVRPLEQSKASAAVCAIIDEMLSGKTARGAERAAAESAAKR